MISIGVVNQRFLNGEAYLVICKWIVTKQNSPRSISTFFTELTQNSNGVCLDRIPKERGTIGCTSDSTSRCSRSKSTGASTCASGGGGSSDNNADILIYASSHLFTDVLTYTNAVTWGKRNISSVCSAIVGVVDTRKWVI